MQISMQHHVKVCSFMLHSRHIQNNNFYFCECIVFPAIKPMITFTYTRPTGSSNNVIRVGSGQEIDVECASSGPFPGRVKWRKMAGNGTYKDVTEIDSNDKLNFTSYKFSLALDEILSKEKLGQVYAYRLNNSRVILGTRRTDIFGAAIGVREISNGSYQCFAENNDTSNSRVLHLIVIRKYNKNIIVSLLFIEHFYRTKFNRNQIFSLDYALHKRYSSSLCVFSQFY